MTQLRARFALLGLASVLAACGTEPEPGTTIQAAAPLVRISPTIGGLGQDLSLELDGVNTQWRDGDLTVTIGDFVQVTGVAIDGPNHATASITIPDTTPLGYHPIHMDFPIRDGDDVTSTASFDLTGDDGFLIEPGGIVISPDRARLGETLQIEITGTNTLFQDGSTWVDLGEGIFVNWVVVTDETHATASVSVDQRADPGFHDVVAFNGPTGYTLMDGLFVERTSVAIEIDPPFGDQGAEVPFVVTGSNTHFDSAGSRDTLIDLSSSICVNEFFPECQDLVEPGGIVSVLTPTVVTGDARISNGAAPGFYNVRAYTVEREDFDLNGVLDPGEFTVLEEIILHDGFEVREVPIDCNDNPGVSFSFSVGRSINNDTCAVQEQVSASAVFYTPLDPPCGSPPGPPIMPFDIQHVITSEPTTSDCPATPTCDAGPFVYLESEQNTITLVRQENAFTGEIGYVPGTPLSLDDYKFGYVDYDLVAEGSEDPTQIPAFRAEDVLFTLPADFELLSPPFCENFTHDPNEELVITWTPGQTYDVAGLSASWSTGDANDVGWQLVTLPWDDGSHTWPSDWMLQMPEGAGNFGFGAGVDEPKWFFDFGEGSVGLENQARSGLSYSGFMILRSDEGDE